MYDAVYAVLQRIGVKSEIHDCTFAFMDAFLSEYFTKQEIKFIEKSHDARNNTKYYVNREVPNAFADEMLKKAHEVRAKCKEIIEGLTEKKIMNIRKELAKCAK